ncbi:hypothetical protein [Streptomyces sp. NBC_00102]|uniref:hypothetical protein n=1 Tax=Streptomyces sp. NBC_00102 TaxID=2975652 RepID=UPI00224D5252|nr:hypothetical protein [Streptomyces sp. NBC_00102]MCX5399605.1 hypothetical protein [Streptomyces sp. NBC_00102]
MDEETYHPELPEAPHVFCGRCGTNAGTTAPPTWMCEVEKDGRQYYCENCARAHIRAIESRLAPALW